jgi:site-specific DNA recombinase
MRAAVYTRISHDALQEGLGVERQRQDCEALCERKGWQVVEAYSDNDVSAAGARKARPGYEAMMAAVEAGTIDVIVAYSNSRLSRRPAEWLDLIGLANKGTQIATVATGQYDLTTADGRAVAMTVAIWDAAEAERTGERVKRQKQQRLAAGMPPASRYRTFGYERDWTVIEEEAAIVRDVFARVARGQSLNAITNKLIALGIKTVSGKPWRYAVTHRMIESPIYAGLLTEKGKIIGRAKITPLIDEATYTASQGRERKAGFNTRKGLLSGIATCDLCKTPMTRDGASYVCPRISGGCGRVRMKAEWLDTVVNAYMGNMVLIDAWNSDKPEVEEDPVAQWDARIEAAQKAHTDGDLDLADLLPLLKDYRAKRGVALREAAAKVEASPYKPLEDYDAADLSAQRGMIAKHIKALMIRPNPKPGNTKFDESRFYVLRANNSIVPGAAINVIDHRDPHYDGFGTHPETRAQIADKNSDFFAELGIETESE